MLYYRFHGFPVAADGPIGGTFARITEFFDAALIRNVPLRFCFFGKHGCDRIIARFPEFLRFLSVAASQVDGREVELLSNFGPSAPGAFAGPVDDAPPETIGAVLAGIPQEFPIYSAHFVLGPILEGTTLVSSSPLQSLLMEMDLQSISLGWQSSPTRDGQRYFLSFIEPLLSADPKQPVPAWIQTLYSAFPGASAEKIRSDADWITMDYGMVVSSGGSFIKCRSIGQDLKLPNDLPDSQAASRLTYAPLRGARSAIARAFSDDGWKAVLGRGSARFYEFDKRSRGGRRLGLLFWIQNHGRSSRTISSSMQLLAGRKRLTVPVLAERSTRHQYEAPNSQVLGQILDNMRIVVKYLESTWIREIEEAVGSGPRDSKPG